MLFRSVLILPQQPATLVAFNHGYTPSSRLSAHRVLTAKAQASSSMSRARSSKHSHSPISTLDFYAPTSLCLRPAAHLDRTPDAKYTHPRSLPNMTPLQSGKATPAFSQSLPGEDEDEDEGEDMTAELRRNTEAGG